MPRVVVEELERGTVSSITDKVSSSGMGQKVHTLTVSPSGRLSPSLPRDPSVDRPVITDSEGYVLQMHARLDNHAGMQT